MDQRAYWDRVAWTKEFTHPFDAGRFRAYVATDARILDLGCGYGRTLHQLHAEGYHDLIGLDTCRELVRRGKAIHPHLDLQVMEGTDIPCADATFAGLILFAVLTCVPGDHAQRHMLDECARVLRPGGIIYISDYPIQDDGRRQERYARFQAQYGRYGIFETPDGGVFRHHDRAWIEDLTAAFESLDYALIDVRTMNGDPAKGFQYFGRKKG